MIRELNGLLPATELMALIIVGLLTAGSMLYAVFSLVLDYWRQCSGDQQVCTAKRGPWMTATS
jgi:hypothetical protein